MLDLNAKMANKKVTIDDYEIIFILNIRNKLRIPSEISKETGLKIYDVSRALRGLKSKGLIICLNEADKRARLYELTKKEKKF